MASIFTQIIRGKAPAYKVWETDRFLAILDINPVNPGHTLLIPKLEVEYIFDLPDEMYSELWIRVRELAGPLRSAMQCRKVGLAVEGFGVPHVHVHLIPVNSLGELSPERAVPGKAVDLEHVQKRIVDALRGPG